MSATSSICLSIPEGWQKDKCISAREMKEMIEVWAFCLEPVVVPSGGSGPAKRFRFKDAPGEVGFISPVSEHFATLATG